MGPTATEMINPGRGSGATAPWVARGFVTLALILALFPRAATAVVREAGTRFHFSATAGSDQVLLRWSATERESPYDAFILLKRPAADPNFATLLPAPIVPLTNLGTIESVFPEGSEIREELENPDLIVPALGSTIGMALLELRSSTDPARMMQREMLINANYGVAIVEGLAYLDTAVVAGDRYAYELWGVEDPNIPSPTERLGKLWVIADPGTTRLPKPKELAAITVQGEKGDGKVYLKWDPSPGEAGLESQPTGFGFDIYRLEGTSDPNDLIADPILPIDDPNSGAVRVNRGPVVPLPGSDPNMPDFFFMDSAAGLFPDPNVPSISKGTSYKYWAVARDHLKQHGEFSDPVQVCVPDKGRPRQVRGVKTTVSSIPAPEVLISWEANTSDPNTVGGSLLYVDDTAGYNVYRFTDFSDLLRPPDPNRRIAEDVAGSIWNDSGPGGPADPNNHGTIFWYAVTAVDAAVCNDPANESGYSAPARAVYYDQDPPTIAEAVPFCEPDPNLASVPNPLCIRDCGALGPSGPPPDPNSDPDLTWCQCGGASGIWPRRLAGSIVDRWGYAVAKDVSQEDMAKVRLYRGFKGSDYRPATEAGLDPNGTLDGAPFDGFKLEETFASRASQKIEYKLRAFDRDDNLGPSADPRGSHGQKMPAYVPGKPPVRPTILETEYVRSLDTLRVRWHAPAAESLAGFIVTKGPLDDPVAGELHLVPPGNFLTETTYDPLAADPNLDPNICDPDGDGRFDWDGDGADPRDVLIEDGTQPLADLIAADPTLGGARDPAAGFFEHSFSGPERGDGVQVFAVDMTGQISLPAFRSDLLADADPNAPAWPDRPDQPVGISLAALRFVDANTPVIELCWNQTEAGAGDPHYVAVFRALIEGGNARGYRQRSPLLAIRAYQDPGGPSETNCSTCAQNLPGNPGSPDIVCWQDRGVGATEDYLYTVLGLRGPPAAIQVLNRDEREVQAAFGPVRCESGECPCPAEGCP